MILLLPRIREHPACCVNFDRGPVAKVGKGLQSLLFPGLNDN
jgi:hypothetical protein